MKLKDKKTFKLKEVVLMVIFVSIVMSLMTGILVCKRLNDNKKYMSNDNENIANLVEIYNLLVDKYYEKVDEKAFTEAIINSMTTYLNDPYTAYLNPTETKELMRTLHGKYEGIGIRILTTPENTSIAEVFDNSPALKAGLKIGDIFVSVNGTLVEGKTSEEIVQLINQDKKKVIIIVKRNEQELTFNVSFAEVDIPSVGSKVIEEKDKKIGYIEISTFAENTDSQFKSNLERLESENISSLIIDLRSNTGGYLTSTTKIIELFLAKDETMYSVASKDKKESFYDSSTEKRDYPIVVLVNEYTASASEILTGALKDSYGAVIVGKTTYGKGKIQQTTYLEDGSLIKYTTSKWYIPSGACIDQVGIEPNIFVEHSELEDAQLLKALEILAK